MKCDQSENSEKWLIINKNIKCNVMKINILCIIMKWKANKYINEIGWNNIIICNNQWLIMAS